MLGGPYQGSPSGCCLGTLLGSARRAGFLARKIISAIKTFRVYLCTDPPPKTATKNRPYKFLTKNRHTKTATKNRLLKTAIQNRHQKPPSKTAYTSSSSKTAVQNRYREFRIGDGPRMGDRPQNIIPSPSLDRLASACNRSPAIYS